MRKATTVGEKKESVKKVGKVRVQRGEAVGPEETPAAAEPREVPAAPLPTAAPAGDAPSVATGGTEQKDVTAIDFEALRKPVEAARAAIHAAEVDMRQLMEHARAVVVVARDDYMKALAPYREACRKAGRACEFAGGRGANVAERVAFLVEKTDAGVRIMVRGRPETAEIIPFAVLEASVGRAAYGYTDRWLGPKETIGNKGGGLGNRIRGVLK